MFQCVCVCNIHNIIFTSGCLVDGHSRVSLALLLCITLDSPGSANNSGVGKSGGGFPCSGQKSKGTLAEFGAFGLAEDGGWQSRGLSDGQDGDGILIASGYVKIAMEHGHLLWIYPLRTVIFQNDVCLLMSVLRLKWLFFLGFSWHACSSLFPDGTLRDVSRTAGTIRNHHKVHTLWYFKAAVENGHWDS